MYCRRTGASQQRLGVDRRYLKYQVKEERTRGKGEAMRNKKRKRKDLMSNAWLTGAPTWLFRSVPSVAPTCTLHYIFLLSSALRISVVKNLITSTKLSAGMSANITIAIWTPFGVLKPVPPSRWLYRIM